MPHTIEKQRHIIDFTLASLMRRKGKNGALFTVYTVIVFILASVMFFTAALKEEAALVLKGAPEIVVQRTLQGRYAPIPEEYAAQIREIRGIMAVHSRVWGYYYDPVFMANYTIMAPEEFKLAPGSIALGSGISRMRRAYEGDTISFTGANGKARNFTIATILPQESQLLSADLIIMNESEYREFSGLPPGVASDLILKVRNPRELATIAEKIVRLLPDTRPIIRNEILRTYDALFSWRGGLLIIIMTAAVLAFIIFAWDKASGLSAEERKEIGILKAVGWETSDILFMKFWEGMAISLTSFLAGTVLAYCHVFFTSASLFVPVLKGWSVLYPQFRLTPFINPGHLATLFFLTVVPYTVTTIIPSWRAATIDPDSVLRS
jgi:ABC-type lipoprotein release transport system permease subunit